MDIYLPIAGLSVNALVIVGLGGLVGLLTGMVGVGGGFLTTPILAAADGRITGAGWAGGYGRQVRIAHAEGLATSYSHMSRFAVSAGQRVRQGQVIGYVGSTGLSTGPHLHYEMYRNGQTINPRSVRFTSRAELSGSELANFRARMRSLLATPLAAARQEQAGRQPEAVRAAP